MDVNSNNHHADHHLLPFVPVIRAVGNLWTLTLFHFLAVLPGGQGDGAHADRMSHYIRGREGAGDGAVVEETFN